MLNDLEDCVHYSGLGDQRGSGTRLWGEAAPVDKAPTGLECSCSGWNTR